MVKTYDNLYGRICRLENLEYAFHKAKKGKGQMPYVKDFEANLGANLLALKRELEAMTHQPKQLRRFVIRDPKTRLISAPHFRDRVVHHALCNVIEPIFERTFIHDSYASRKGKGTHAALRRFDEFKRRVSRNGRAVNGAKDGNMVVGYALKADIRHYFASVSHEILLKVIGMRVKDERVLWLIGGMLESYGEDGRGMPIGALSSQLFANIYLNELDYFVKYKLRAKYYIRYMDDFVLLHESTERLARWEDDIGRFLKSRLRLELHPEKTSVFPLHAGIGMLGYRVFYHHKLLKRSSVAQAERRIDAFERQYLAGELSRDEIMQSFESWLAFARCAESYKQRKMLAAQLNRLIHEPG